MAEPIEASASSHERARKTAHGPVMFPAVNEATAREEIHERADTVWTRGAGSAPAIGRVATKSVRGEGGRVAIVDGCRTPFCKSGTVLADRQHAETAYAGDIIGIHNHGTINIGDSFSEGEVIRFTGIPNFAPEIFRRAVLKDPLRLKALHKGLAQLCEEGATQLFKPMRNNDLILGAVGPLQFEVVAHRLHDEYKVECQFEAINVATARWVECDDAKMLGDFEKKAHDNLALDHSHSLVYIAPTRVNLSLTAERWPDIAFRKTREHSCRRRRCSQKKSLPGRFTTGPTLHLHSASSPYCFRLCWAITGVRLMAVRPSRRAWAGSLSAPASWSASQRLFSALSLTRAVTENGSCCSSP